MQPVWRADRPQKGRFREFYQCDVDATGSTAMTVEAELLAAGADVLTRLGFTDFTIRLNHRQLLAAMLDAAGVPGRAARDGAGLARQGRQDRPRRGGRPTWPARGVADGGGAGAGRSAVRRPRGQRRPRPTPASWRGWRRFAGGSPRWPARRSSELTQILALVGRHRGGRAPAARPDAGPRAGLLHRRDLRDRGGRPGRQPRRRRPLRRPGRHVPRPAGAGVRAVAGPRADPGGDGRARDVPGRGRAAAGRRAGGELRRGGGGRDAGPGGGAARRRRRRRGWPSSSFPTSTSSASSSSTRRNAACRSWR